MSVFIDTSAFYAILDRDDGNHSPAAERWGLLLDKGEALHTTNYVVVETSALVQHRLGMQAARLFTDDVMPMVAAFWITEAVHRLAAAAWLTSSRRKLSLVDCASFAVMRELRIRRAFAFDAHFSEQGFQPD